MNRSHSTPSILSYSLSLLAMTATMLLSCNKTHMAAMQEEQNRVQDRAAVWHEIREYERACEANTEFQQCRTLLSHTGELLSRDADNENLIRQYQAHQNTFERCALYQRGCVLHRRAQDVRRQERSQADPDNTSDFNQRLHHEHEARRITYDYLRPILEILRPPNARIDDLVGLIERSNDIDQYVQDTEGFFTKVSDIYYLPAETVTDPGENRMKWRRS